MERIERAKIKAKIQRERADLKIERLEQAQLDEEARLQNEKREKVKLQTEIDHNYYKIKEQEKQDLKNEANTPEARTRESFRHAREIRDREISRGLTKDERAYKNMDAKDRIECSNMIASGEVKDVKAYLKWKRQQREASERNRRRLKGI